MKHLLTLTLSAAIGLGSLMTAHADAPTTGNPHELAQRFAGGKLSNMLFSTTVDPHWFQQGNKFWYSYKTAQGTRWYIVDPASRRQTELFDHDRMAAQLTEIVKDPMIAASLPIRNLEASADGRTFTFEVTSTIDAKPKKDADGKEKKPKAGEKEIFYFSYDTSTGKLTHLKDKEEEKKQLDWASVSPDGQTVVYAKDLNLYRMSRADYEKLKKTKTTQPSPTYSSQPTE